MVGERADTLDRNGACRGLYVGILKLSRTEQGMDLKFYKTRQQVVSGFGSSV
jgi:hypothetical protein